jgi:hypothetical protein
VRGGGLNDLPLWTGSARIFLLSAKARLDERRRITTLLLAQMGESRAEWRT